MNKHYSIIFICSFILLNGSFALAIGTADESEQWGYVEVRPNAHMFWWLYKSPFKVDDPSKPWPIILWLQGGPGGSGVAFGNFLEIGPLDVNLKPRNSTWLMKADLLFVDNPVGTGYSYVEDTSLLVKSDEEAAIDLSSLLKVLFNGSQTLQNQPFYIFAESYGGKFAVTLALSLLQAIQDGELRLRLGGVALGDSWISPEDFVFSWGPLLKDMSRLDDNGLNKSNNLALQIQQQIARGNYEDATATWNQLENVVEAYSNGVDFYNLMLDINNDPVEGTTTQVLKDIPKDKYSTYLKNNVYYASKGIVGGTSDGIHALMNGPIREKLKIIPKDIEWGAQSELVFEAMNGDFMRPRIIEVDELLTKGVNVSIYNGQVDLICSTKGVESWINKLKWVGLTNFLSLNRTPLYCEEDDTRTTKGFTKSYKNLFFHWILDAGHFVPVDQPCISLQMVGFITQSPN